MNLCHIELRIASSCVLSEPHKQQGYGWTGEVSKHRLSAVLSSWWWWWWGLWKLSQSLCDLSHLSTGNTASCYVPGVHIGQLHMSLYHANLITASPAEVCLTSSPYFTQ